MKILSSTFEAVRIDSLTARPENPRRGDIEAVAQSIDQNGFYGAVIAQVSTRRILLGNLRWKAAKKRGAFSYLSCGSTAMMTAPAGSCWQTNGNP